MIDMLPIHPALSILNGVLLAITGYDIAVSLVKVLAIVIALLALRTFISKLGPRQ